MAWGSASSLAAIAAALLALGALAQPEVLERRVVPGVNDGKAVYRLIVPAEVPAEAWSVSVGGESVDSATAKPSADGAVAIQFGDCDDTVPNCLPTVEGWSYTVRLRRPRPEALDGRWRFPPAVQRSGHFGRGLRG